MPAGTITHWSPTIQPTRALCGAVITPHQHAQSPTCPDCQTLLAAMDDGKTPEEVCALAAELNRPVKPRYFDPILGRYEDQR